MRAIVPYSKAVRATPPGYWDRGTRVLIFAGPDGWDRAREWLDVELLEIPQARHRYTLVCPRDMTSQADVMRWPVDGKAVVIVRCGGEPPDLCTLVEALQRDGCSEGEIVDLYSMPECVLGWGHSLRMLQPWSWATWDAEVMSAYRDAQLGGRASLIDAAIATAGSLLISEDWPSGSLGAESCAELALRATAEAA